MTFDMRRFIRIAEGLEVRSASFNEAAAKALVVTFLPAANIDRWDVFVGDEKVGRISKTSGSSRRSSKVTAYEASVRYDGRLFSGTEPRMSSMKERIRNFLSAKVATTTDV